MKRIFLASLALLLLAVGCTSTETNSNPDELPSLSADSMSQENADASLPAPPNQVFSTTPAEAAPAAKPVTEVPVVKKQRSSRKHKAHKKVSHRKRHKRSRKHV
jgi:hypothetical protein